jgi:predicted site-specific integrase-resolvase
MASKSSLTLKVSEVASVLGVSGQTVRRLGRKGLLDVEPMDITARRPTYLVSRASLLRYLENAGLASTADAGLAEAL